MSDPSVDSSIYKTLAAGCMRQCAQIAESTDTPGQITRLFLSPAIRSVHQMLADQMNQLGLDVRTDDAGNLIGKRDGVGGSTKSLLIGSHLDTVPGGGKYDGALGVAVGLAVVQALGDVPLPFHLEVIAFSEEEGVRFAQPYLGSHAIAGSFDAEWLDRIDRDGDSMRSVVAGFGLSPDRIPEAAYPPESVIGFIETHIEQGPLLKRVDRPVGTVDGLSLINI